MKAIDTQDRLPDERQTIVYETLMGEQILGYYCPKHKVFKSKSGIAPPMEARIVAKYYVIPSPHM
jgi:hypothetical protein